VKRNLIELYALLVCFASIFFLIVSGAITLYQLVRVVEPSLMVDGYTYRRGFSDALFMETWPKERPVPDPATVTRLRKEAFDLGLEIERHTALNHLGSSLMYLVCSGLVFWLHWRLAEREHAASPAATM
jgi:hypothetical protein